MNAITYFKYLEARRNTLFRITPTGSYYVVDEREIPIEEFEATYPLPFQVRPYKVNGPVDSNPDKTKNWLFDD
jgi:hypothetical protein